MGIWDICLVFVMLSLLFNCCLVVTCWERTDLLALVCNVCVFITSHVLSWVSLCKVWYLIVSIPDLCQLSYFAKTTILSGRNINTFGKSIHNLKNRSF